MKLQTSKGYLFLNVLGIFSTGKHTAGIHVSEMSGAIKGRSARELWLIAGVWEGQGQREIWGQSAWV